MGDSYNTENQIFKRSNLVRETTLRSWRDNAACKGMPASLFFPESLKVQNANIAAVRVICNGCAVRKECLSHGMSEPLGIWGGFTHRERITMKRDGETVDDC